METRANYVLIGAVTLLAIVGGLRRSSCGMRGSRSTGSTTTTSSGSTRCPASAEPADVRFNGILVGQVISIDLSQTGTAGARRHRGSGRHADRFRHGRHAALAGRDRGLLCLAGERSRPTPTPLAVDPTDRQEGDPLRAVRDRQPDRGRAAASAGGDGVAAPAERPREPGEPGSASPRSSSNVETASGGLEKALSDFSAISGTVREGVDQISAFTGRLDGIATQAETTLKTADTALNSATGAFDVAKGTLGSATGALDAARTHLPERRYADHRARAGAGRSLRRRGVVADDARWTTSEPAAPR